MYLPDYPLQLGVFVTNRCNFSCSYCIMDAQSTVDAHTELSTEEIFNIIDLAVQAGVWNMDFSGGEPLCRPDFKEIVGYALRKGLEVSLVTNGSLLDEATACDFSQMQREKPLRIRISLDAAQQELNDGYRFAGSYAAALQALNNLQKYGILPELSTVFHRRNQHNFPDLLNFMADRKLKVIHINPLMATGRGQQLRDLALPLPDFKNIMLQKEGWEQTYGITIKADTPLDFLVNPEKDKNLVQRCLLGYFFLGIHANGDIYPCPNMMDIQLGNIRSDDLISLWRKAPFLQAVRNTDLLKEDCATCQYKLRCGGGCRALAWQERGDYLCPDPYCWIANPAG
ncbi:radical SAM/SPASM domain-containing protein [Sporomusa sp. GT1]|uniref:radical SAM/SPASM domain-containing protein n=1 Tax=Sporomusa sp. GT1 TaxID=1534747 RepID=UPI001CB84E32|nr:radical SAM protein [Sporomusa sp. GT1]